MVAEKDIEIDNKKKTINNVAKSSTLSEGLILRTKLFFSVYTSSHFFLHFSEKYLLHQYLLFDFLCYDVSVRRNDVYLMIYILYYGCTER